MSPKGERDQSFTDDAGLPEAPAYDYPELGPALGITTQTTKSVPPDAVTAAPRKETLGITPPDAVGEDIQSIPVKPSALRTLGQTVKRSLKNIPVPSVVGTVLKAVAGPITPEQKLIKSMRGRMYDIFSRGQIIKTKKTLELLGCSQKFLKEHIEKQFKDGMSWKNYGKWHIDHIIPINYFVKECNFKLTKTQKKCFNYNNLQPMWAYDNLQKGSRLL